MVLYRWFQYHWANLWGWGNAGQVAFAERIFVFVAGGEYGGSFSVYQGVDKITGSVKYIGITERTAAIRFSEHLNSVGTGKELLRYSVVPGATNLSRLNARIMEQTLINQYGLKNLLNVRNSIAPKYWPQHGIPK